MYTGNNLEDAHEPSEGKTRKHLGVCFETKAPTSLHHVGIPSILLKKDEEYNKQTVYSFLR